MALDLSKPRRIGAAITAVLASRVYAAERDDEGRAYLLTMAVCDALSPLVPRAEAVRHELELIGRDKRIRDEFDGRNYSELAARHGRSTRQIRRIVDDPRKRRRVTP